MFDGAVSAGMVGKVRAAKIHGPLPFEQFFSYIISHHQFLLLQKGDRQCRPEATCSVVNHYGVWPLPVLIHQKAKRNFGSSQFSPLMADGFFCFVLWSGIGDICHVVIAHSI